jgi:hypothetical protein
VTDEKDRNGNPKESAMQDTIENPTDKRPVLDRAVSYVTDSALAWLHRRAVSRGDSEWANLTAAGLMGLESDCLIGYVQTPAQDTSCISGEPSCPGPDKRSNWDEPADDWDWTGMAGY